LRIDGIEWTPQRVEQLVGRVALVQGVTSSRFAIHCASLTVVHIAAQETVLAEVRLILLQIKVSPDEPVQISVAAFYPANTQARAASRRLIACAAIGLVIALMPGPVAPAMILLRLFVCAVTMAIERHALTVTEMPPAARWLGAVAFLVSLARADNITRALGAAALGQAMSRPGGISFKARTTIKEGQPPLAA